MRTCVLAVVLGMFVTATPLQGQARPRRGPRSAFAFAVLPYVGLGFRGARANEEDEATCPATPDSCFQHKASGGPELGIGVELPLFRGFGLAVHGSVARAHHLVCLRGQCSERDSEAILAIRGSGFLQFRFKARAPIFFGLGGSMARFDPGPVFSQVQAVTEFGFAGIVGYDFALGSRYGGRITWMSFFMKPDAQSLTAAMTGRTSAYDAVITVGGRIGIGR